MYNDYDDPNSGQDDGLYEDTPMEKIGGIADQIKPFVVPIILVIILLIGVFVAYDFFIGSKRNVSFNILDTEGDNINGANIIVFSISGEEIARVRSGQNLELKIGPYNLDVRASGFERKNNKSITVSGDGPIVIVMEINKDLELEGTFPENFFSGEQISIDVTVINNESDTVEINLVLDKDAEEGMEISYNKPLFVFPGTNQVIVTLKADTKPDQDLLGGTNDGVIRIEGLNNNSAKIRGDFTVTAFSSGDIRIKIGGSSQSVDFKTVKAGSSSEKELRIENKSDNIINDITVELEITNTKFSPPEEVEEWFIFSPSNTIESILPEEIRIITIIVNIPSSMIFPQGENEEIIDGVFRVKSSFFEKEFNLDLKVKKPKTGISIKGISNSFTFKKDDGGYDKKSDFIDIRNTGDVLLTDFSVIVTCNPRTSTWLSLETGVSEITFPSLVAGATKSIPFLISIPSNITGGQIANCKIGVFYTDPSGQQQTLEEPVLISTSS